MTNDYSSIIAQELNIPRKSVAATIKLLDDGATIPFISRYRKEATGALDEVGVHNVQLRYEALKALAKRKETILDTIKEQGKLTAELKRRIEETLDSATLEDLYMPFRPRRRTRAQMAAEKGLEPLARMIMAQNLDDAASVAKRFKNDEVPDVDSAIAGACDIMAEWMSESEKARSIVRSRYMRNAVISSKVVKGKEEEGRNYENYYDFSSPLRTCTSHRLLAILRGADEGFLKVTVTIDDDEMIDRLSRLFVKAGTSDKIASLMRLTVKDSYKRLIKPSIESEALAAAKVRADDAAIAMFAENVRQLLLAPPLGRKRVLAIDPGFRTGCKIVCLDEQGNLMHTEVIYPNPPQNDFHGAAFKLSRLVESYRIDAIAVGNGTASRETEKFLESLRYPRKIQIFVVSENGASIYSASKVARDEFPDYDVTVRGAVSIGRRLIDPLAELVKIDPKSIGVGQYQHDVDQGNLKNALDYTVMSCVNAVGVDVNTASEKLLSYVSGIGPALAANIVAYRAKNGDFATRKDLKKVPRLGDKAFELAAGFLRVPGGKEPLDNTGIHPESYGVVTAIARQLGVKPGDLAANSALLDKIDVKKMASLGLAGEETITDIIAELRKPGRDPRIDGDNEAFVAGVNDFEELRPGMVLPGIVNNITAFGAFVNLGIKENGLIHISQMSRKRVNNVGDVLKLGQRVEVKVLDVDSARRRIGLSLIL